MPHYRGFLLSAFGLSAIFAASSGFSQDHVQQASSEFRWAGKILAEYNGANAAYIRQVYQPVIDRYPDLSACRRTEADNELPSVEALSVGDIQELQDSESREVCIFYALSGLETTEDITLRLREMGFAEPVVVHEKSRGTYITAYWDDANGPISGRKLMSLVQGLFGNHVEIRVSVGKTGDLTSVRLVAKSRLTL